VANATLTLTLILMHEKIWQILSKTNQSNLVGSDYIFIVLSHQQLLIFVRRHRSSSHVRPIATDIVAWSVCLSV